MSRRGVCEQGDYVLFSPCVRRREELLRTHMRPVKLDQVYDRAVLRAG